MGMAGEVARGQTPPSNLEELGLAFRRCRPLLVIADELVATTFRFCEKLCALGSANSTDDEGPRGIIL